VLSGVSK